MSQSDPERRNSIMGGVLILLVRAFLLWLVVPVAALARRVAGFRLRSRGVAFWRFLGWVDLNLIAFLQRVLFRPMVRSPISWVPARDMPSVTHRLRAIDPA